MNIPASDVKKLRDRTGLGMMDCKKALVEAGGDMARSEEVLRKRGLKAAELRAGRNAAQGRVGAYIHLNGKMGVLAEINCETDFVAKTPEFRQLVKDLCMQIAATNPKYVGPEEVPADVIAKEKEIMGEQFRDKPAQVLEKILEGKIKDYYKQVCLLDQPFIKDTGMTVRALVNGFIAKLGENIVVKRFVRFAVGEEG